jgi:hypothetical protein
MTPLLVTTSMEVFGSGICSASPRWVKYREPGLGGVGAELRPHRFGHVERVDRTPRTDDARGDESIRARAGSHVENVVTCRHDVGSERIAYARERLHGGRGNRVELGFGVPHQQARGATGGKVEDLSGTGRDLGVHGLHRLEDPFPLPTQDCAHQYPPRSLRIRD